MCGVFGGEMTPALTRLRAAVGTKLAGVEVVERGRCRRRERATIAVIVRLSPSQWKRLEVAQVRMTMMRGGGGSLKGGGESRRATERERGNLDVGSGGRRRASDRIG